MNLHWLEGGEGQWRLSCSLRFSWGFKIFFTSFLVRGIYVYPEPCPSSKTLEKRGKKSAPCFPPLFFFFFCLNPRARVGRWVVSFFFFWKKKIKAWSLQVLKKVSIWTTTITTTTTNRFKKERSSMIDNAFSNLFHVSSVIHMYYSVTYHFFFSFFFFLFLYVPFGPFFFSFFLSLLCLLWTPSLGDIMHSTQMITELIEINRDN